MLYKASAVVLLVIAITSVSTYRCCPHARTCTHTHKRVRVSSNLKGKGVYSTSNSKFILCIQPMLWCHQDNSEEAVVSIEQCPGTPPQLWSQCGSCLLALFLREKILEPYIWGRWKEGEKAREACLILHQIQSEYANARSETGVTLVLFIKKPDN